MEKRGQVTIFIILAIFLVGIIMLLFLIPKNIEKPPEPDTNQVYPYVRSLIENEAFKCLQQIGLNGGYYNIPNQVYVNETSYWYYEGVSTQPFLNTIENETSECINEILKNTTNEPLEVFGNHSIRISEDRIKSKVRINEWRTTIEVDYPIAVSKGSSTSLISDFEVDYRINLLKLYELATGIVNYASIPEFDKCNPSNNCYGEDINFSFFNEGENLFIKGQTFAVFSNQSREEPYELNFAIKRPIKEAFEENGKSLAVLYQDEEGLETFGGRSLEVLSKLELTQNVDYYGCEEISEFIQKIDDYDIVMITGNLQYQIVRHSVWNKLTESFEDSFSEGEFLDDAGELLFGCNEFNNMNRKNRLKNWVNSGGILWINDVKKYETDKFVVSYLGYLGYKGGLWQSVGGGPLSEKQKVILENLREEKDVVKLDEIKDKNHYLLTCPNDISKEIVGTWRSYPLEVTSKDEIIIGSQEEAILWIRELGNGYVIFDQFLLKDNLYSRLEFNDDLYSKGLAEKYFVNVLNYLAKSEEYKKAQLEISLVAPLNDEEIESPIFYFQSQFGKNASYNLLITEKSGTTKSLKLENKDLIEERFSNNKFKIDLTNKSIWTDLNGDRFEWQIKMNEYFSDIGSFRKKLPVQINETTGGNETNGNSTI